MTQLYAWWRRYKRGWAAEFTVRTATHSHCSMKVHVEEKMLAVLAMMTLAVSVSDSRLLNKCDLMAQLNAGLPANLVNQSTEWAKIICHVELSTGFNTRAIQQVMTPNGNMSDPEKSGKSRPARSHGTSTEHHDEDEVKSNINAHQNNSTPGNGPHAANNFKNNGSSGMNNPKVPPMGKGDNGGRRGRSLQEFSSEESSGGNSEPASPEISSESDEYRGPHHSRHARSHETSRERHGNMDKVMFNNTAPQNQTMPANGSSPVMKNQDGQHNSKESKGKGGGRRGRSVQESSSEESSKKHKGPKNKHVPTVKPVKMDMWTLYGLFQLPNLITCISGSEPSLNLCNMTCNSLINDDISDDITCLDTIISKALSVGGRRGPAEVLIQKFYTGLFQKECSNVVAPDYFSNCPEI